MIAALTITAAGGGNGLWPAISRAQARRPWTNWGTLRVSIKGGIVGIRPDRAGIPCVVTGSGFPDGFCWDTDEDEHSVNRLLADAVTAADTAYYGLVLLVGQHGSGKSRVLRAAAAASEWPVVNLGVELAQALVSLPESRRSLAVSGVLEGLVASKQAPVVALDDIEVLFEPSLRLQPLELLKQISRSTVLVVAWPGTLEMDRLTFGETGRPEHITLSSAGVSALSVESISNS